MSIDRAWRALSRAPRHVDVVLFVEHVARELDVSCAVKHLVAQRHGLRLEIASISHELDAWLDRYAAPRLIVTPYCYSAGDSGFRRIFAAWPHTTLVNLAYEQVFQRINLQYKAPRDDFAKHRVTHHAWSADFAEFLVEHGVDRANIVVNGNPALALYRPPYRSFFAARAELAQRHGLDVGRQWLFLPENYAAAFYSEQRLLEYAQRGGDAAEAAQYRDFAQRSLAEVARWLRRVAEETEAEVIVRPRPATPEADFRARCEAAVGPLPPRFRILKQGTVREWIMAADAVASSYSTTLIEAAVAERPIYMLTPIPYPDFVNNPWYDLVPKVTDAERLLEIARGQAPAPTWRPLSDWASSRMLSADDVIRGMADLVASAWTRAGAVPRRVLEPSGPSAASATRHTAVARWQRGVGRSVRALRTRFAAFRGAAPRGPNQDAFSDADVAWRVARWSEVLSGA